MESNRFDTIAKWLARGRISRRTVVRGGALALAATARVPVFAQTGTPTASPAASTGTTEFLAVQSFGAGTLTPSASAAGTYTLVLSQGAGRTLYFSDRPERVVGTEPIQRFLLSFGFDPSNPPNAALVVPTQESATDTEGIYVVELHSARYDSARDELTYEVRVLEDANKVQMHFSEAPQAPPQRAVTFGPSTLFIDSGSAPQSFGCDNHEIACYTGVNSTAGPCTEVGSLGTKGFCLPNCNPCDGWSHFDDECNATFPACSSGGGCVAQRNDYCECHTKGQTCESDVDCCGGECNCLEEDSCVCT